MTNEDEFEFDRKETKKILDNSDMVFMGYVDMVDDDTGDVNEEEYFTVYQDEKKNDKIAMSWDGRDQLNCWTLEVDKSKGTSVLKYADTLSDDERDYLKKKNLTPWQIAQTICANLEFEGEKY